MPFELHVAVRYLLAKRKQAFISVISLISILGVVVGVMALVIALALMTGLQGELRDRLLGSTAHVYVMKVGGFPDYQQDVERLRQVPEVLGAAPALTGQGLAKVGDRSRFMSIKGIDPTLEKQVTDIGRSIKRGRLSALGAGSAPGPAETPEGAAAAADNESVPGIVLGQDLAKDLGVTVGDDITVLTAQGTLTPFGMAPRSRRLRVVGTFSLGLYEFDTSYGFVALSVAERLLDKQAPDMIELRIRDIYRASDVANEVTRRFGDRYMTEDWASMNKSLFSALWLEKMAISITIGLIVMVAALNIVASLILLVMEKHSDIAILKTMGATTRSVMAIFMLQGLVIGIVGTAVGAGAGWAVARVLDKYRLIHLPMDVYQVSYVPFTIQPLDFAMVVGVAILICFLATIYPARQAAKLEPAEALRYG
ncbi:MAG: FtsX-like permease family protein [Bacteroidales bacterium]